MRTLTLAPRYNTPGKHDATGAFQPERAAFSSLIDPLACYYTVDNHATKPKMRLAILSEIHVVAPTLFAVFSHGWRTGIQFGFGLANVDELAVELARGCTSVRVALYCCSTGSGPGVGGDGGFADMLRDALCRAGAPHCQVDAHDRSGHCCRNPFVRRFDGMGSASGGIGGHWIVAPNSALWKRWVVALKSDGGPGGSSGPLGPLRFRFPLMDVAEIHAELAAAL